MDRPVSRRTGGPVFVVGAGPSIGASVARRFAREAHPVGLIARDRARLQAIADDLRDGGHHAAAVTGDITDPGDITRALGELTSTLGTPEVVCFSPLPDVRRIRPVLDTTTEDVKDALALTAVGATAVVQAVLPGMLDRGSGTLLFTTGGAAVRPSPERAVSAVVYAGLSGYSSHRRCRDGGSTSAASPSSAPWGRDSPTNPTTSPNTSGTGTPHRGRR